MKRRLTYLLLCFAVSIGLVTAQTTKVTGNVISAEDNEPIIGATVVVKGTSVGAVTDFDGNFSLDVPASATTLVISYVGKTPQEVAVAPNIRVALVSSSELLEEVIVVAYGTTKKESFTGSATTISNEKIERRTVSDVSKALEGQSTGVISTSGSGQPGSGASIRIRGYGSINASQSPLYVVDGMAYEGDINALNPGDIESMSVLKDASAGALYGARGANGVIIITTKKGKSGEINVSYKGTVGFSSRAIPPYEMVDQREFMELTYEGLRNGYAFRNNYAWEDAKRQALADLPATLGGEQYNPFKNYAFNNLIDLSTERVQADAVSAWDESWLDAITRSDALRHEHQFSVTGGTDKLSTMFSLAYLNEEGLLEQTDFERYTGRLNINAEPKKWMKAFLNASFAGTSQDYLASSGTQTGNVWYIAQFMAPIYPVYLKNSNGTNELDALGNKQFDYGKTRPKSTDFSCIGLLYDDQNKVKSDHLSARTGLTFGSDEESAGWLQGLKLSSTFGIDYRTENQLNYYNMYHGNQANANGLIYKINARMQNYTFNQLLTWNRQFGDHNFDFLVAHEYTEFVYNYLSAGKSNLVDGIIELRPGTTLVDADSYTDTYKMESYFSRFNYNFREKYYLSLSWRTDGSSRFEKSNRWGNFWSAGANWRLSQEAFMEDIDWLDNLSVKASYGLQGNDGLLNSSGSANFYAWQSFYNLGWPNANYTGARVTTLENKLVSWEKNENLNVGIESRFLDSRLIFDIEYYNRKTTDLLLSNPKPLSTGFTGYYDNIGSMNNSGLEFTIRGKIVKTDNFEWDLQFMGSTVKNKVLKLTATSPEIISGVFSIKEGLPLNTFYMAKSAGVDPATGAQMYWVYDKDDDGNIVNERISSDVAKAAVSKYYLGSRIPDLYGSISTDLVVFKDFDLSVMTTYSIGGKLYDSNYLGSMNAMYVGDTWNKHALRRWQKPGDITDVPRLELNPTYQTSDRFLIDASYFAIKNVTLGYTLPKKVLNKIKMQKLRIFGTLDNLYTFTHLVGVDPQYNFSGTTAYSYTPNKTISFGIDINF